MLAVAAIAAMMYSGDAHAGNLACVDVNVQLKNSNSNSVTQNCKHNSAANVQVGQKNTNNVDQQGTTNFISSNQVGAKSSFKGNQFVPGNGRNDAFIHQRQK